MMAVDGDELGGTAPPAVTVAPRPCVLTDAQLVVAVARRRAEALAELYDRHGGAVHSIARRMCGSDAAAEDVTHEVFLHVWREPEGFDLERTGSVVAALVAQTHQLAIALAPADATRPATGADGDVGERARRAFAALPVAERDAIALASFGGYSYRRVAELLGQTEDTVTRRIRRGLVQLRSATCTGQGELDVRG